MSANYNDRSCGRESAHFFSAEKISADSCRRLPLLLTCFLFTAVAPGSERASPSDQVPLSRLPLGLDSFMPVPVDNPMTAERIALGRELFFNKRLSRDGTVSCASCHHPDKASLMAAPCPLARGLSASSRLHLKIGE